MEIVCWSASTFTKSPFFRKDKLVLEIVSGIIEIVKKLFVTLTTVRLIPFIETYPFLKMYPFKLEGILILRILSFLFSKLIISAIL